MVYLASRGYTSDSEKMNDKQTMWLRSECSFGCKYRFKWSVMVVALKEMDHFTCL